MRLDGKVALVTGASGGLGSAVVEVFAAAGARVVAVYSPRSSGLATSLEVSSGSGDVRLAADLTDEDAATRVVAEATRCTGRLDVLVNAAGGWAAGETVAAVAAETWSRMMRLNLDTAFYTAHAALATMLPQRSGRIINVASRAAVVPSPGATAYATSKSALVAFTLNLAEEVRQEGVTVNVVLPSIIDTPANRASMPDADHARWPKPHELARVILFLASDDAAVVSGAAIPVYGREVS